MAFSWTRCELFIDLMKEAIAAGIPDDPRAREGLGGGVSPSNDEVMDALTGAGITMADFIELDERPGRFDSNYRANDWHRCLRVLRNDPNDDRLFDYLNRRGEYEE